MADFNIVVDTPHLQDGDIESIFGDGRGHVEEVLYTREVPLDVLLRDLGIYKSTSEARRAGRSGPIPSGYTELKASRIHRLYIWNPSE